MTDAFESAKAFLLKSSDSTGLNVYDHLTDLISKLLDERPSNAADVIEDVSYTVKTEKFQPNSLLKDNPVTEEAVVLANAQTALFKRSEEEEDEETEPIVPNIVESARHFEDAGVGVGSEETFRVLLALKQLAEQQPLQSVRFWGKILGIESNYYVAECVYREGEEPQPEDAEEEEPEAEPEEDDEERDDPPKSEYKAPKPAPAEDYGSGVNKKVYFVCSDLGTEWKALPHASPEHIVLSRQIKKFFTGHLDAPVVSYPPFTGTEAHLLRAQIARITAGTHVSPLGLYTFDEEDDEEDEDARENFIEDEEFEGKPRSELVDATLAGWAHHSQYILSQGRCKWVNPNPKGEDEDDEDDEDEEDEEEEVEPETGPPLLQPLQNDDEVDSFPAWSPKSASQFASRYSAVVISSNRWPGAHAYAIPGTKKYDNIYIGWGVKASSESYNPPLPPAPQNEYANGEEVTETADPTREEEEEYEASQKQDDEDEEEEEEDED